MSLLLGPKQQGRAQEQKLKSSVGQNTHWLQKESWGCPCSAPCSAFIYSPCNLSSDRRKEQLGPRSRNQPMEKWRKQQASISAAIHFSSNSALPVPVGELCACSLHMACTSQFPSTSQSSSDAELCPSTHNDPDIVSTGFPSSNKNICLDWKGWVSRLQKLWEVSSWSVILYFMGLKNFLRKPLMGEGVTLCVGSVW